MNRVGNLIGLLFAQFHNYLYLLTIEKLAQLHSVVIFISSACPSLLLSIYAVNVRTIYKLDKALYYTISGTENTLKLAR